MRIKMPGSVEFAYPSDRLFESCLKGVTPQDVAFQDVTPPFNQYRRTRRLSFPLVALPTAVLYVVFLVYRHLVPGICDNLMNADDEFSSPRSFPEAALSI